MLRKTFAISLTITLLFQMNEFAYAKTRKQAKATRSQNYERIKKADDFFSTSLFSNSYACDSNDFNFFSLSQSNGCIPKESNLDKEKTKAQSDLGEALYKMNCNNASPDISVNFSNPDSVKYCKNVSKCLNSTFAYIDSMDPQTSQKMQCTLLFLTDTHKSMRMEKSVQNVFKDINTKDSLDNKLTKLMKLVATNLPKSEWNKVHFCPMKIKPEENCVSGMSNELVKSQVNKYLSNVRKKEAEAAKVANAQNQAVYMMVNNINVHPALRKKNKLQTSANPDRGTQAAEVVDDSDKDGSDFADFDEDSALLKLKTQNAKSQMSNEDFNKMLKQASPNFEKAKIDQFKSSGVGSVKLEKEDTFFEIVKKFDINYDEMTNQYIYNTVEASAPLKGESAIEYAVNVSDRQMQSYSKYLIDVSNKILDKYCEQSVVYNAKNYCAKIESELRDNDEMDRYNIMDKIGSFVEDVQSDNINNRANGMAGISSKMIKDANRKSYDTKFNYGEFMSQVGFMQTCVQHFGKKSFNSEDEENQFAQLNNSSDESLTEKTNNVVSDQKRNLSEILSRSNDSLLANSINKNQKVNPLSSLSFGMNNDGLKSDNLNIEKKVENVGAIDNTRATNGNTNLTDANLYNSLNNSVRNNSQTVPTNNNSYVYQPSTNNLNDRSAEFEPNSIQKKIDELNKKQDELKSKNVSDSSGTSANSKEVDALQKQIEELRSQLAESQKNPTAKVIANSANSAKDAAIKDVPISNNSVAPSFDFKKQSYSGSNSNQYERSNDSSSNDNSRFESGSIGSSGGSSGSQAIGSRSTGSVASSKSVEAVKSFGLVLTKSGEMTEDISKIADNPKDADILVMAEKSNGQPFIIRENGDLVQVQLKVDAKGKPVYVNGKPEYIKKKLTKDAQVQVAKNLDAIREVKEVRDTVRLQQLNQLMQDSK